MLQPLFSDEFCHGAWANNHVISESADLLLAHEVDVWIVPPVDRIWS